MLRYCLYYNYVHRVCVLIYECVYIRCWYPGHKHILSHTYTYIASIKLNLFDYAIQSNHVTKAGIVKSLKSGREKSMKPIKWIVSVDHIRWIR